ncbi:putative cysteine-rich receptor-like protein kinase 9 [Gastrolobium bilobum]|uniref:putative cysteine-rich receptor-like protein kinase 9 n=1 Tax=Gastrolobium bilobum TaxID=150636 RepID=UPI002AB1495B|nr:putative cysteine-rich receptor-like protein kinase 9 [Gastrolobium bilobum]
MNNPFQTCLPREFTPMPTSKYSVISTVFLSALIFLVFLSEAAPIYSDHYCTKSITYQPNTTFQTNLNHLISSLSSKASEGNHFYRTKVGSDAPNMVNGLFLCRGDILTSTCHECVSTAAREIKRRCSSEKEAIIWFDVCMLRYSNQYLNNIVPSVSLLNSKNISRADLDRFNELLAGMLNALATKAENSLSDKFATEELNFTSTVTLYGLVQCTPDLTVFECNMCFRSAIASIPNCCNGKQGARVLLPGCNIRYELYPFYNTTSPVVQSRSSGRKHVSIIISFVIPIVALVVLFILCSFVEKKARKRIQLWKKSKMEFSKDIEESDTGKSSRNYSRGNENAQK